MNNVKGCLGWWIVIRIIGNLITIDFVIWNWNTLESDYGVWGDGLDWLGF